VDARAPARRNVGMSLTISPARNCTRRCVQFSGNPKSGEIATPLTPAFGPPRFRVLAPLGDRCKNGGFPAFFGPLTVAGLRGGRKGERRRSWAAHLPGYKERSVVAASTEVNAPR
jgi:hypothetical protein